MGKLRQNVDGHTGYSSHSPVSKWGLKGIQEWAVQDKSLRELVCSWNQ